MADIPGLTTNLNMSPNLSLNQARVVEVIFRCVQEALTNTLKHTNATHFWVRIDYIENKLHIQIQDNGRTAGNLIAGNGLNGMKERVEQLDGQLIWRAGTEGVTLDIFIPKANPLTEIF